MCTLIVRPSGSWLPSASQLDNAWLSNPHGFGAAWAKNGDLNVRKTLKARDVSSILELIPADAPCILHWRYSTHGTVTKQNCHPFAAPLLDGLWVGAHNGVLSAQLIPQGEDITDSEAYLRGLKHSDPIKIASEVARLGSGKLALLSAKGQTVIANEAHGEWMPEGYWRSNAGLEDPWLETRLFSSPKNSPSSVFGSNWGGEREDWEDWEEAECFFCRSRKALRVDWESQSLICRECLTY